MCSFSCLEPTDTSASGAIGRFSRARPIAGPTQRSARQVLLDVVRGVLNRTNLLGIFVRDVDLEGFFEGQDQLNQTERIGAQIVDERRLRLDVLLVHVELLFDDPLYFGGYVPTFSHDASRGASYQRGRPICRDFSNR